MSLAATQRKNKGSIAQTKPGSKRLSSHVTDKQRGLESNTDVQELESRIRVEFDLETKFGPVTGMTRLERYERAERMQLSPPVWVKEAILAHGVDSDINLHLFNRGKI